MDIPDLVKGALDGEEIQAGVSLGDEDAVCLTPTRTLVYRGEGLLSDEAVEEYSHDIEQLAVSEGRRKTKFTMQYIDGTRSFTVPANRGDKVLELFLEGVLKLDGVIEARESLAGVYRFSELTLIISEGRLIKHIGSQVWSEDYEVYAYDDVTGLEFERASVATSIALSVAGRPQRIKVPNDKAPVVRQTLEQALFSYYDVGNVEELNRVVGPETDAGGVDAATDDGGDDFAFGDDFDPLVSDEADLTESVDAEERLADDDPAAGGQQPASDPTGGERPNEVDAGRSADAASGADADGPAGGTARGATERAGSRADSGTDDAGADSTAQPGRSAESAEPEHSDTDATDTGGPESPAEPGDAQQSQSQSQSRNVDAQQSRSETADAQQSRSRQADAAGTDATSEVSTPATEPVDGGDTSADRSPAGESTADAAAAGRDDTATNEAGEASGADGTEPVTREEFEAMAERLDELTDAVDRQNELLKRQHRALKQLVQQRDSE